MLLLFVLRGVAGWSTPDPDLVFTISALETIDLDGCINR
uniref:Uncharacterized protein n=1 Tax=Setaria viridis TaxID=4556 RepID=A0A4U6W7A3_SETVI|nr:hypothetical protein SEVIR_1G051450v2 [Setaria viridis]